MNPPRGPYDRAWPGRALMRLAMVALGGLLLLVCSGREPARTPAGDGVVGMLAEVSDVRPGLPVMVFVYTDG